MGVPTNTINILNPTIPIDQGLYETSETAKARLGTELKVGERTFRYARASSASDLVAGRVSVIANASTGFGTVNLTIASTAAGALIVTCTSTSLAAANAFAEGYFHVSDLTGEGLMARVKSNSAGSTGFTVTLYDQLPANLGTASKVGLIPNPYAAVTLTATGKPAGVNPIAVTSSYYFWLQTKGPANVLRADTAAAFSPLKISATAGALDAVATGTLAATGSMFNIVAQNQGLAAVDTECSPCFINFD
jgi:hypothetical protein